MEDSEKKLVVSKICGDAKKETFLRRFVGSRDSRI